MHRNSSLFSSFHHLGGSVWLERMMRYPGLCSLYVGDECDVVLSTCYSRKPGVFLLCLGYCDWKLFCLSGVDFSDHFLHSYYSLENGGWNLFLRSYIMVGSFYHR